MQAEIHIEMVCARSNPYCVDLRFLHIDPLLNFVRQLICRSLAFLKDLTVGGDDSNLLLASHFVIVLILEFSLSWVLLLFGMVLVKQTSSREFGTPFTAFAWYS